MRILLILPWTRTAFELGNYCKLALEEIGYRVDDFKYFKHRIWQRFGILEGLEDFYIKERLYHKILSFKPKLILVIKGDIIPKDVIIYIKKRFKIPLANYWIDDPYRLEISRKLSPLYDFFFTNDINSVNVHKDAGCPNVAFLTFGCMPNIHKKISLSPGQLKQYRSDICFSGTVNPERAKVFEWLVDFDIKIWAPRFIYYLKQDYKIIKEPIPKNSPLYNKFTGQQVWGKELVKVYNAAKIVLNIHSPQTCPIMRDFEVTACGAFLLTDYVNGLEDFFKINQEIVCFKDKDELRELINFYLRDPQKRQEISMRGQQRAYLEHTYVQRMKELISFIKDKIA
ncbi:MAG: glycosyltransferase [Candidatus Omnitrophica bacterium]|nr:glycosyltransferase [Candidatus Omnitrophota bacterium]